ncbi:MAG: hypothetical protein HYS41_00535 [Candidatus Omnitrophica bacterium]|nr:hypothetical protein [Candidatus Omnitrophota bacterium]
MKRFAATLSLLTVLALFHVQMGVGLIALGYRVEALHRQREQLLDLHRVLQYNVLTLRSPAIISGRLKRQAIELVAPQEVEVLQRQETKVPSLSQAVSLRGAAPSKWGRWFENVYRFAASLLEARFRLD